LRNQLDKHLRHPHLTIRNFLTDSIFLFTLLTTCPVFSQLHLSSLTQNLSYNLSSALFTFNEHSHISGELLMKE